MEKTFEELAQFFLRENPQVKVLTNPETFEDVALCGWGKEIFPTSEMQKEKHLGFLCLHCKRSIESRGESLEFVD